MTTRSPAATATTSSPAGAGDDTVSGNAGDDTLDGGAGANILRGGGGVDTARRDVRGDAPSAAPTPTPSSAARATDIVALDGLQDTITCGPGKTDTVSADLGANGVTDKINNPTACETVTGTVAADPGHDDHDRDHPARDRRPGHGTPALVPVLAPGTANFADLTPPSASMRSFTRQRLATVVKRGVPSG